MALPSGTRWRFDHSRTGHELGVDNAGLLTDALVQAQTLQSFVGGEGSLPATDLVVLGQGDGQLGNQALGGSVGDGLFQQTLGQAIMPVRGDLVTTM